MEKQATTIIVSDYSNSPGPRYCYQGDDSGEDFYHKILNKEFNEALELNAILEINLDGPDGYASSFLDEAFGNLVYDFGLEKVRRLVKIISDEEPEWIDMIQNETYLQWEQRRINNLAPRKTMVHDDWWRYNNANQKSEKGIWITHD